MKMLTNKIIKHKKTVLSIFILFTVFFLFASNFVSVNYNLMDYLPDEAKSTISLNIMNEEYDTAIENLRIVVKDVGIYEALEYKEKIGNVDGVKEINWLDDTVSINVPLETISNDTVEAWYKDGNALFSVVVDEDKQEEVIENIREIIGEDNLMSGEAYNTVSTEHSTSKEIASIMKFIIPLIFVILLITTDSWFEPVLFLATIGIAIIQNIGTNAFLGEISFVTNAAASILQLAVSMDYSIFLLHRFSEERQKYDSVEGAMKSAMNKSYSSILSSGLTTVIGFAALILMNFKIGPDMGTVMAKAIALSLINVLVLLPVLAVYSYKLIDKTKHKKLVPCFEKFGKLVNKLKTIAIVVFVILILPCNLASKKIGFTYGASEIFKDKTTGVGYEKEEIERLFGKSNNIVLMVPKGDFAKEKKLTEELKQLSEVKSVISYVNSVGSQIPMEYIPGNKLSQLISEKYSRMVISIDRPVQGDATFKTVEALRETANKYYPNTYEMCGESVNTYDMKETVIADNVTVNAVAIISIAVILLFNFKSIGLPILLVFVIELSIWINLSFPYFLDENLNYISYLIISSIQLGATVDYAILYTDRYLDNRKKMGKKLAVLQTTSETTLSILTSGGILAIAGMFLGILSTNQVISELGILVGRGAIISVILVLFTLPALLTIFDKLIQKTTLKLKFKEGI